MIQHAKKWKVTVCGSFIHRTICRIYLFSSDSLNCAVSIVRARYSTKSYLNQGITKRSYIFIFAKFSYRQRNPLMKNFKTKKKYLYHLGNFNSPLPLQLAESNRSVERNFTVSSAACHLTGIRLERENSVCSNRMCSRQAATVHNWLFFK